MIRRITRRAAGTALALLLLAGASGCRTGQDNSTDSTGKQHEQQDTSGSAPKVDAASQTCADFRRITDASKPTKAERKLSGDTRLRASYKSMRTFYAAFARLFPESAASANALSTIYDRAYNGRLTKAEEAKIGGLDQKINAVIDKHCPNSGYPAN